MLKEIKTTEDVIAFAKQIIDEGVSFHCDDDFKDYVKFKTGEHCYTQEEAELRNELMNQCFEVSEKAGVDVYEVMGQELFKVSGLGKYALFQ